MADRGRPILHRAAIYASASEAVQPPDDRTYSAEVTVFRRNLLHHRSARAVIPVTRLNNITLGFPIVKHIFRKNHKVLCYFSLKMQSRYFCTDGIFFGTFLAIISSRHAIINRKPTAPPGRETRPLRCRTRYSCVFPYRSLRSMRRSCCNYNSLIGFFFFPKAPSVSPVLAKRGGTMSLPYYI